MPKHHEKIHVSTTKKIDPIFLSQIAVQRWTAMKKLIFGLVRVLANKTAESGVMRAVTLLARPCFSNKFCRTAHKNCSKRVTKC